MGNFELESYMNIFPITKHYIVTSILIHVRGSK